MTSGESSTGIGKKASVTIEAAAELVDIDAATIRHWSETGALEIEVVGDMEVVRLDRVHWLSQSAHYGTTRAIRNAALKERLGGATTETLDVTDLQELARDRERGSAKG
jgi:transcriptional antiterminator Rof (Rho-off)